MFDLNRLTPDALTYFNSMPPLYQELLIQSGADYTTRQELENFSKYQAE